MKLAKAALLLLIPVLALLLFGRTTMKPAETEATPQKILTIDSKLCFLLTAGNWVNPLNGLGACGRLDRESNLRLLMKALRTDEADPGDDPQPEELASIDSDGGQIHDTDGYMNVLAWVSTDQPVRFYAEEGRFLGSDASTIACGPADEVVPGGPYQFTDDDCDGNGIEGDGVVGAVLKASDGDRGPAELTVRQGHIEMKEPYTIVGEPHNISIKANKAVIQTGSPRCDMFAGTASFIAALTDPETTPLMVTVTDDDGTPLSAAIVGIEIDEPDRAEPALALAPTMDLTSSLGSVVAPNVVCGTEEPGPITITATILSVVSGLGVDSGANADKDAEIELMVVPAPTTMELSASPASFVCDGTATTAVSATLKDDDSNLAVNGNRVSYEVKALGIVNPALAKTADGVATTTLSPLAGVTGGVVVHAWLEVPAIEGGDEDATPEPTPTLDPSAVLMPTATPEPEIILARTDLEKTFLVACEGAAAPSAPPVAPPAGPGTTISPPGTGTGADGNSASWIALPMGIVATMLVATGLLIRRRTA